MGGERAGSIDAPKGVRPGPLLRRTPYRTGALLAIDFPLASVRRYAVIADDSPSEADGQVAGVLDALANPRRRRMLRCLRSARSLTLDELARAVAERERSGSDAGDVAHRIGIDLYHCQLPRLARAGLLHYDRERSLVAITERGVRADRWLREAGEPDRWTSVE